MMTIIVLIILAAISIMMLSGNDGILARAGNAKVTIGQATAEEEVKRTIMSLQIDGKGSNNGITPSKIAEQVNKDNGRTDVTAEGENFPTNIVYGNGTKVYVNLDLTIGKKEEDPNAIYSENIDEEQIAPDDLFTYEPLTTGANNIKVVSTEGIDSLPSKTIKITGIKSEYLYKYSGVYDDENNYKINYNKGNFDLTHLLIIPAKVEYEGEYYTVTEVDLANREKDSNNYDAGYAFPIVETIIYPNTVTKIYGIEFSLSSYIAYRYDVKNVILPNKIKEIPKYFFADCGSLTNVKIPESVTKIATGAFKNCRELKSINIPDGIEVIEKEAFRGCGLEKITIPDNATNIWEGAFSNCYYLQTVKLPNGVTSIGNNAFSRCSDLQNITIPESVTSIGNSAFSGCEGLQNITIPKGVTNIGGYAFSECTGLQNIIIPDGVTSINGTFSGCKGLQSITIPDSVTSIGNSTFSRCTGLKNITIPEGVTSIGDDAFYGCTGLQNITIPEGVTSIGWRAFSGCTCLQNITIPNSVTSTDSSAFSGCTSLNKITINKPKGSLDYSNWKLQKGTTIVWSDGEEVVN